MGDMSSFSAEQWLAVAALLLAVVLGATVLRKLLGAALRLAGRTALGMAVLMALQQLGGLLGFQLGVNWFNALVLGALGAPGLGLLLMANLWVRS